MGTHPFAAAESSTAGKPGHLRSWNGRPSTSRRSESEPSPASPPVWRMRRSCFRFLRCRVAAAVAQGHSAQSKSRYHPNPRETVPLYPK
jgi:hypothetical protein